MQAKKLEGHAFISYVHEDSYEVDRLQRSLEEAGIRVWRDTADLWPGEDWRTKIRHAITDDALAFIACFSRNSLIRRKSYQNEELYLAIDQLRQRRPDQLWLIPVRFDDCDIPDIEIGSGRTLASIQRADIFDERSDEQTRRLVLTVQRILGSQSGESSAVTPVPKSRQNARSHSSLSRQGERSPQTGFLPEKHSWTAPLLSSEGLGSTRRSSQEFATSAKRAHAPLAQPSTRTSPGGSGNGQPDSREKPPRPYMQDKRRPIRRKIIAAGAIIAVTALAFVWTELAISQPPTQVARPRPSRILIDPQAGGVGATATAFSPNSKMLATGDSNGKTYLWDVTTGKRLAALHDFRPATSGVFGVAFSPNGKKIAVADLNGNTYLWNVATRRRLAALTDSAAFPPVVAFDPQSGALAIGDTAGKVYIWDIETGRKASLISSGHIAALAFSSNGSTLAVGTTSGEISMWNISTVRKMATFSDPHSSDAGVRALAFSPSGKILATGDINGSTYLWDTVSERLIGTFADPSTGRTGVNGLAFNPNGTMLVTGDLDGSSYIWTLATARNTAILTGASAANVGVNSVAFSPDGKTIVASDSNGRTYIWNTNLLSLGT